METAKNRRSSILKPQKPRNPLSDLDLVEPVQVDSPLETTKIGSLRRVSFASSNFVKEFATDPEKNTTVWDTTYEEMLNKSDSTHSSEITHNPCDTHSKKQSVVGMQHITRDSETVTISESVNQGFITSSETAEKNRTKERDVCNSRKASINFYEQGGEDMILDSSLCEMNICETRIIETGNIQSSNEINVINTARQTDNMVIPQQIMQNEQCHLSETVGDVILKDIHGSRHLPQVSPSNAENLPFTKLFDQSQILTAADKENIPTQSKSCITNPVFSHRKFCLPINRVDDECDASLSNIEHIVKKEQCNILKHNKGFSTFNKSSSSVKIDTVVDNGNIKSVQQRFASNETTMELIRKLQSFNKSERDIKNKTVVADENMEITLQLPVLDKNNYNPTNKTIMMDESIECTQALSACNFLAFNANNNNESPVKNVENKIIMTGENMSITQQFAGVDKSNYNLPNMTIMMDERIECTLPIPTFNFPALNANHNNEPLGRNNENRTCVVDESMATTQQLPVVDKSSYNPPNKTIMMDESIECTRPIPTFNFPALNANHNNEPLARNNENRTRVVDKSMATTQQLPVDKSSYNPPNKTIMMDESIECTRPILTFNFPAPNANHNNEPLARNNENRTCVVDESMATTQQLPVVDKSSYNPPNKTIMMDESIECNRPILTFNFPALNANHNNEPLGRNNENRTCVVDESMATTQQLPVVDKSSYNPPNKTIMMDESIECNRPILTFNFPALNANHNNEPLASNNENRTCVVDESMATTQQLPVVDKSSYNPPNKTIMMDESIECTRPILTFNFPAPNANHNNEPLARNNENRTRVVDESMATTQQLPVVDKSSYNPPNETIMMDESIECTRPIPAFNSSQINEEDVEITKAPKEILSISKHNINCSGLKTPGSSFHMTFTPFSPGIDDTQHLINYSLTHKQPKSDFSKIITGDLNPSFLSSKFMPLGEFSSDAFPVSLETSRNNQTHSEHMEFDKVKDWDIFPKSVPTDHNNGSRFQHEELSTDTNSDLPVSAVTIHTMEDKNSDAIPGSLEFVNNNQSHIEQMQLSSDKDYEKHNKNKPPLLAMDDSDEINVQVSNLKCRSLQHIETVVISEKPTVDNIEENDAGTINIVENVEATIADNMPTNISQEDITFSDSMVSVHNTFTQEAKELITNITQSISANASMDMSTYQLSTESKRLRARYKGRILMKQKFEDFLEKMRDSLTIITRNSINLDELYEEELKEIARPLQQHSFEDIQSNTVSSDECSLVEPISDNTVPELRLHFSDLNIDLEKVLTFKEKIEEKHKKCKRYWNILSIEDDKCEIDTFYKTVRLTAQFNKETGIVNNLDICYKISDESEPVGLFVHKICKDRLSKKTIQSAVGEHYDILTLLDYVYMNMKKMIEILNELDRFAKRHNLKMDYNFRVTFKIVILQLRSTWSISVDMSDIENINEDSVTAYAKIGTVDEAKIKGLVAGCPSGILFLKSFIDSVLSYIDLLKNRKLKEK